MKQPTMSAILLVLASLSLGQNAFAQAQPWNARMTINNTVDPETEALNIHGLPTDSTTDERVMMIHSSGGVGSIDLQTAASYAEPWHEAGGTVLADQFSGDIHYDGGRVGIGAQTPLFDHHVNDIDNSNRAESVAYWADYKWSWISAGLDGGVTRSDVGAQDGTNQIIMSAQNDGDENMLVSRDATGDLSQIWFKDTYVGIKTHIPDQLLTVNGNASKMGGGDWATFSDRRLKQNIQPYSDGLAQVLAIEPVTFEYNGKGTYEADGNTYVGVIAQDVQAVAPYMVSTFTAKLNEDDAEPTELLQYDSSSLVYMLVNAMQEQQRQINDLRAQVEALTPLAQTVSLAN